MENPAQVQTGGKQVFFVNHDPTRGAFATLVRYVLHNGEYSTQPNDTDQNVSAPNNYKRLIGCTVEMPNPFNTFIYAYWSIKNTSYYCMTCPGPGGEPSCADQSCPHRPPAETPTAFPAGAPTSGHYQLTSIITYIGQPICLETRRDDQTDGGRIQQQDCRNNGQTSFQMDRDESKHTYTIRTFAGRYLAPRGDSEQPTTELLGLGADQFCPPGCAYSLSKQRWLLRAENGKPGVFQIVNQGTGHCLQIDGSDLRREGRVNLIQCRNNREEQFTFRQLTLIPLTSDRQTTTGQSPPP